MSNSLVGIILRQAISHRSVYPHISKCLTPETTREGQKLTEREGWRKRYQLTTCHSPPTVCPLTGSVRVWGNLVTDVQLKPVWKTSSSSVRHLTPPQYVQHGWGTHARTVWSSVLSVWSCTRRDRLNGAVCRWGGCLHDPWQEETFAQHCVDTI